MKNKFKFGRYIFESLKQFQDLQLVAEKKGLETMEEFYQFLDQQFNQKQIIKG